LQSAEEVASKQRDKDLEAMKKDPRWKGFDSLGVAFTVHPRFLEAQALVYPDGPNGPRRMAVEEEKKHS